MSRYNLATYGLSTYDGAPYEADRPLLALEIDWDEDGYFDGTNEGMNILPSGIDYERGREWFIAPNGDSFEHVSEGRMTIILNNESGRYDPRNHQSPLYPNISPGKLARLQVYYNGEIFPLFAGMINDLVPSSSNGVKTVKITLTDGVGMIRGLKAYLPVQEQVKSSDMMTLMFDALGYPWGTNFQVGVDTIRYYWCDQNEVLTEVNSLADSELGFFYFAADGKATYKNRYDPSTNPLATLRDNDISPNPIIRLPWEVLRNRVVVTANPLVKLSSTTLWALSGTVMVVRPAESISFWIDYSYENQRVAAQNIIQPSGSDFSAWTSETGGLDISSQVDVSVTPFASTAKVTLKNNYSSEAYVRVLNIKGQPILNQAPYSIEKQTGKANRTFSVNLRWQSDVNTAISLADLLLNSLSQDQPYPVIELYDRPELQFRIDIGTYLALDLRSSNVTGTYRVTKVRQTLVNHLWKSTYWLEPYSRGFSDMWKFPTEIGVTSKFAY